MAAADPPAVADPAAELRPRFRVVGERLQAQQRRTGLAPGCPRTRAISFRRALNGARSTVSIFMLSSTSTGAPASTSAPTASGVATTSAGAGRADDAALVAADPVRHAVHLDQVDRARAWR